MGDGVAKKRPLRRLAFDARGGRPATLVCVFLRGGADTLNLLVPYGDDRYYRLRPLLAIPQPGTASDRAIRLDELHALHPRMAPLAPIYHEGGLAFIQGVGTDNPSGSHFEAQDQIEHGLGFGETAGGGWLGRHLRSRQGPTPGPLSAVAISATMPEALRGAPAASAIRKLEELRIDAPPGHQDTVARMTQALTALYGARTDLLGDAGRSTLALLERVAALRETTYVAAHGASYGSDDFSKALWEVARLIKAGVGLEVACVDLDGWDTHFVQGSTGGLHGDLASRLAQGLAAFYQDLADQRDEVTIIVMTEFGRRIYENASLGTDHGRGFTMMALGGGVLGGRIHGAYPSLEPDPALEAEGPGGLAIRIDYRSVLAEALLAVCADTQLARVFPGYTPQAVGAFG